MNKERRKQIAELAERARSLQLEIESLAEAVGEVRDAEQEYFDNMPESFQNGDRGQRAQEAADALDSAHSDLEGLDLGAVADELERAGE